MYKRQALTLLLNHVWTGVIDSDDTRAVLGVMLGAFLERAGLSATRAIEARGAYPRDIECFTFDYGKARVLALLREPNERDKRVTAKLSLPEEKHVYDALAGTRILRPKRVLARLRPGDPAVYAALPYEVAELRVEGPGDLGPGQRLPVHVMVKAQDQLPGDHIVRIELAPLGGRPLAHYAQNLVCRGGEATTFIPLALDEAPGVYEVRARDVMTGTTGKQRVRVMPAGG